MFAARQVLIAAFLIAAGTAPTLAHGRLWGSSPISGIEVAAPKEIKLEFSEPVIAAFSRIQLTCAKGPVAVEAAAQPGPKVLLFSVAGLAEGACTVHWRAAFSDTHVVTGQFGFTVAP